MRPQMGYYDSLIEEAAALLESLAMNHPFVDGNKRNGLLQPLRSFSAQERQLHRLLTAKKPTDHFMRLFETNSFRFAELRSWLEEHVKPLPGP